MYMFRKTNMQKNIMKVLQSDVARASVNMLESATASRPGIRTTRHTFKVADRLGTIWNAHFKPAGQVAVTQTTVAQTSVTQTWLNAQFKSAELVAVTQTPVTPTAATQTWWNAHFKPAGSFPATFWGRDHDLPAVFR